jgi:hypothetical protein
VGSELKLKRLFAGDNGVENLLRRVDHAARRAIEFASDDEVLACDSVQWTTELIEEHVPKAPKLLLSQKSISPPQSNWDPVLFIPFDGDPELFDLRVDPGPGSMGVSGFLIDGELQLKLSSWGLGAQGKDHVENRISEVQRQLDRLEARFKALRDRLSKTLPEEIEKKQISIRSRRSDIAELGIPIRVRRDAPSVMREPGIARRPRPVQGKGRPNAAPIPGPVLSDEMFNHIVEVVRATGRSMSRSPLTYKDWDEEDRRQMFVLMLNTHYQGEVAAEAFNFTGKTDILVRVEDRNVFIAECKWWRGAKSFEAALEQLFSYAAWDDARLALIIFVDQQDFSIPIKRGFEVLRNHPRFRAEVSEDGCEIRVKMHWPGDIERLVTLHVMFIHTPRSSSRVS